MARPKMPVPPGEMSPQELCDRIRNWAVSVGYEFELLPHGSEFGVTLVRDPAGGSTRATVPKAHKGRRLRRDQVRYTVGDINRYWQD
jgi:hypothetical protein